MIYRVFYVFAAQAVVVRGDAALRIRTIQSFGLIAEVWS
jgi:hypothetical protein